MVLFTAPQHPGPHPQKAITLVQSSDSTPPSTGDPREQSHIMAGALGSGTSLMKGFQRRGLEAQIIFMGLCHSVYCSFYFTGEGSEIRRAE